MVRRHLLLVTLSLVFVFLAFSGTVSAQQPQYHLVNEWTKIWINKNGTIDLFYDVSLALDSGPNINFVLIGQPQGDFTIGPAKDQFGHNLTATSASSGTDYKVRVNLYQPLSAGQTVRFNLTTNVAHMIYEDNQTNVGMQFTPTWWTDARVQDLRILIVLPPNVNSTQVNTTEVLWNGTQPEDGRLGIFWEKQNLFPDQRFPVGVSYPKQAGWNYDAKPSGVVTFLQNFGPPILIFGVFAFIIGAVVVVVRKRPYLMPTMSMETLGIRRGLTAVEASYLLGFKPTKIVTETLYSLLQKRVVWAESTTPTLKLKIMEPFKGKTGTTETPLRYYEIDFLQAIREDGTLDEERLAKTVVSLRDTTEEKMRGYRRNDTIDYYKGVVTKAWEQVQQAGTPELASNAYNEQLLWLFLDPNYQSRTETAFRDRAFEPNPLWLWYWYGYQHYRPNPTYRPNVENPAQAAKPPTIPGADFANNIAKAVENTSNNIVSNLEKFANAIVPAPAAAKASSEPAHHAAGCVCACAACACACACVSCACACAGGGVG